MEKRKLEKLFIQPFGTSHRDNGNQMNSADLWQRGHLRLQHFDGCKIRITTDQNQNVSVSHLHGVFIYFLFDLD